MNVTTLVVWIDESGDLGYRSFSSITIAQRFIDEMPECKCVLITGDNLNIEDFT